jgi:TonB family protein
MIKEKWGYPCVKDGNVTGQCDYKSAQLVIVFDIIKSGRVSQVRVQETSGYKIYDDYAANAVRLASPFPPLPSEMMASAGPGSPGIRIIAAFKYKFVEHEGNQ